MATYAILGATGNCGNALIQNLLRTEDAKINAYCRNKQKLLQTVPQMDSPNNEKRVRIYEGSIHDIDLLAACIRGTRAVFHVVATNDNVPGCHISLDTARSLVSALGQLKAAPDVRPRTTTTTTKKEKTDDDNDKATGLPKVVLLSSATIDDHLSRHMPWWFRPILRTSASHVYEDLRRAEAFLRGERDWVQTIFIKPGGLSVDVQRGHELNLDHDESFVSYLDLAAGMIEAADEPEGRFDQKNVCVVNRNGAARFPPGTPMCILSGLARHFFPFLHNYLPTTGPG